MHLILTIRHDSVRVRRNQQLRVVCDEGDVLAPGGVGAPFGASEQN